MKYSTTAVPRRPLLACWFFFWGLLLCSSHCFCCHTCTLSILKYVTIQNASKKRNRLFKNMISRWFWDFEISRLRQNKIIENSEVGGGCTKLTPFQKNFTSYFGNRLRLSTLNSSNSVIQVKGEAPWRLWILTLPPRQENHLYHRYCGDIVTCVKLIAKGDGCWQNEII